jgi:hypothetical protein
MTANVSTAMPETPIPDAAAGSTTVTFRLRNELLAALDAKAQSKSLSRSSLIILGINEVLGIH